MCLWDRIFRIILVEWMFCERVLVYVFCIVGMFFVSIVLRIFIIWWFLFEEFCSLWWICLRVLGRI